jgi:hypothetical protein
VSAMDTAARILAIANSLRRLAPTGTLGEQPERFRSERSEIVADLVSLAEAVMPGSSRRPTATAAKDDPTAAPVMPIGVPPRIKRGSTGSFVLNGRHIVIQHRRASFAV